jgi:hypothetical protein
MDASVPEDIARFIVVLVPTNIKGHIEANIPAEVRGNIRHHCTCLY